ncbi:MAG: DUF4197 domain-containing protein [Flavobacteriales bacterium]|nr:DUF4197 domain-containing protein [Flavobacteriales bacterium]
MRKAILYICLLLAMMFTISACAELQAILKHVEENGGVEVKDVLSNDEIIRGLKDALVHGADSAVARLSVKDGFYGDAALKILLPKEAKPIYDRLEKVPIIDGLISDAVLSINRAAEDAATEAKPIFLNAIKGMTIQEGMSILRGADTSATHYLRQKTYHQLYNAFKPKIQQSLEKKYVGNLSAESSYKKVIDTYNTASVNGMLWDKIKNNSLSEHTTKNALNGLFIKVAKEEKMIRENPIHRVTDILKRVFGYVFES